MNMKNRGRLIMAECTAIVLSLIMAFTVFPLSASAATGDGTDGGSAAEAAATRDFVPGQLIVVTENDMSKKQIKSIVKGVDGQVDTVSSLDDESNMTLIEVEEGSELSAAAELECEDRVLFVQPNYIYQMDEDEIEGEQIENEPSAEKAEEEPAENEPAAEEAVDEATEKGNVEEPASEDENTYPNDPYYYESFEVYDEEGKKIVAGPQKNYLAPTENGGEAGTANAKGAWDQLANINNKEKPLVAVIDSGVRYTHEDLEDSFIQEKCVTFSHGDQKEFTSDGSLDDYGHGTKVAGIIGAGSNNGIGVAGIAGNRVRMFAVDTYTPGEGHLCIDVAMGIEYATDQGADLINLSLGGYGRDYLCEKAVEYAWKNGTLCICSAGNGVIPPLQEDCIGTNLVRFVGDCPYAISVMAHEWSGEPLVNTNYGVDKDVSAPGINLSTTGPKSNKDYSPFRDTSSATPVVTGAAALLLYANPDLTPREIKNLLYTSTGKEDFSAEKADQGFGRINIGTAMNNLLADKTDPEKIVINRSNLKLYEGGDAGIEYAIYPGNTKPTDVKFTSSDENIASVDTDGIVTAKASGSATITVKCKNHSAQCEVTVSKIPCKTIDRKPIEIEDYFVMDEPFDAVEWVDGHGTVTDKHGYYYKQFQIDLEKNETITAALLISNGSAVIRLKDKSGNNIPIDIGYNTPTVKAATYTAEKAGTYQIQAIWSEPDYNDSRYYLRIVSDKAFCKPSVKSISNGQMTMSWPAVDFAAKYRVRKYADKALTELVSEEEVTATEFTDTSYDKSKVNYYTVTSISALYKSSRTEWAYYDNGETPFVVKLKNPMSVKGKTVKVKRKKLRRKSVSLSRAKVMTVSGAKGTLTFTKASGNKRITIASKTGVVNIKKGLKKGKYKVKVKVRASGNGEYNPVTNTVTFMIRVR